MVKIIPGLIKDVLANITRKPATIGYPKTKAVVPEGFRGKIWVNEKCIACGACARACPALAIKVEKTQIKVWTMRCVNCARCVDVCPVKAINYSDEFEIVSDDRNASYIRKYVMAKCKECGKEFDNKAKLEMMAEKTKQPLENFLTCIECKQKKLAAPKPAAAPAAVEQKPAEAAAPAHAEAAKKPHAHAHAHKKGEEKHA